MTAACGRESIVRTHALIVQAYVQNSDRQPFVQAYVQNSDRQPPSSTPMEVTILGLSFGVGVSFFGFGVLAFGWPLGGFSRMSAAVGVEAFLLSCLGSARRN